MRASDFIRVWLWRNRKTVLAYGRLRCGKAPLGIYKVALYPFGSVHKNFDVTYENPFYVTHKLAGLLFALNDSKTMLICISGERVCIPIASFCRFAAN